MGSPEEKERAQIKRRNRFAKLLRDQNDYKGAFSLKVHDGNQYKRKRLRIKDILEEDETDS